MRLALIVVSALVGSAVAATARADWQAGGNPVCTAVNAQRFSRVVSDGVDGAIVCWTDYRGGSSPRVFAQHMSGQGQPLWALDGVPICSGTGSQGLASSTPDDAGGAFVVFDDGRTSDQQVYLQRITGAGLVAAGWSADAFLVSTAPGRKEKPSLQADGSGGAYVAWWDARGGIYAQRVTGDGLQHPSWLRGGVKVASAVSGVGGGFNDPRLVPDGSGGLFVIWEDYRTAGVPYTTTDLYAQHLRADGSREPGWAADGLPVSTAPSWQADPAAVSDGSGGVIVAWADGRSTASTLGSTNEIYGLHLDGSGGIEPGWQADGNLIAAGNGNPRLVADGAGGAVVVDTREAPSTDDDSILARRFAGNGILLWPNEVLLSTSPGCKPTLDVVADVNGGLIAAWTDSRDGNCGDDAFFDVYAQGIALIDGSRRAGQWIDDGVPICDRNGEAQENPSIAAIPSGGAIVVWRDGRNGNDDIFAARLFPDGRTPTLVSLVSAKATCNSVELRWHVSELAAAYAIYRRDDASAWATWGQPLRDSRGVLSYEDRAVVPGRRYGYRLAQASGGPEQFLGETWVNVPTIPSLSLDGLRPNPTRGDLVVAFSLASDAQAVLDLIDASGRIIVSREISGIQPGGHLIRLREGLVPPGLYFVRISQSGQAATGRIFVVR